MTEKPISEDERVVREAWENVVDNGYVVLIYTDVFYVHALKFCGERNRWKDARAYTDNSQREIADVEQEIAWLNEASDWARDTPEQKRILAREQAALEALQKGLRK